MRFLLSCTLVLYLSGQELGAEDCRPCPRDAGGCVQGEVEDTSGGYLPGAKIRLVDSNALTGHEGVRGVPGGHTLESDGDGRFFIDKLPPRRYQIEVAVPGFSTGRSNSFQVDAGRTLDLGALTLMVRGSAGPEYRALSIEPSLCPEKEAPSEGSYPTQWSTPEAVSDWVRLLGAGRDKAMWRVESEGEITFVRIQPASFLLSQPDILHILAANWPSDVSSGDTRWAPQTARTVVDPARHIGVRLRIRHNTPFRFISGFWAHRSSSQETIGEPNYAGMPSFRGHRVQGDGMWHDVNFWFGESPYFEAGDAIVLIAFSFSGEDGMTLDEESSGWKSFEAAHESLTSDHHFDIESIELVER